MPSRTNQDEYPTWVGFVFVFNLIVGTGALTLPSAFARTGWLLSIVLILALAFMSYVTVTFIVETMACANAVMNWKRLQYLKRNRAIPNASDNGEDDAETLDDDQEPMLDDNDTDVSIEHTPLCIQRQHYYSLSTKLELGEMTGLFFNKFGRILFYCCIVIYLYGDLSIYSAAVAKSLRDVVCASNSSTNGTNDDIDDNVNLCWTNHTLTRLDMYRLCLIGFIAILGPFVFFNVQKTKYLQILTVFLRWLAFTVMIALAIRRIILPDANTPVAHPAKADIAGIPYLIGTCIYSFMCHHSLPSLLTPIADKSKLRSLISWDYLLISAFYLSLALTGVFAFADIKDLYTLNFVPDDTRDSSTLLKVTEYFLTLFPVFTLSASFPIIAITLKNNLQTLFMSATYLETYNFCVRRFLFPILAIVPPIFITFFTESVLNLVGFTGGYAGTGIQYIIPAFLVYSARKTCHALLGHGIVNAYQSPFRSNGWLIMVAVWTCGCLVFVSIHFFTY